MVMRFANHCSMIIYILHNIQTFLKLELYKAAQWYLIAYLNQIQFVVFDLKQKIEFLEENFTYENIWANPLEPCVFLHVSVWTFACSTSLSSTDCPDWSQLASLCLFQMIVMLIKHNWLTISVLFTALLTRFHPLSPSPILTPFLVALSQGPVAKATGI